MKCTYESDPYFDMIVNIAYEKYCTEVSYHSFLKPTAKKIFSAFLHKEFSKAKCITALENDQCIGFILFYDNDEGDENWCSIPVWGYGANNEKTMSYLFSTLAENIVTDKTTTFSVRLYAHDQPIQRLFTYMQFGIICERTVRQISKIECDDHMKVRKMDKEELIKRWNEIWYLLSQLINHLKKSPVFYPGKEFTESVYQSFLSSEDTTVYIAEDENKIVGLIEANSENYDIAFMDNPAVNVGEAYVLPQYRGKQLAQALLSCLENDLLQNQHQYDWVQHGTANPNARGFWNKYFETFEYEFIRKIER